MKWATLYSRQFVYYGTRKYDIDLFEGPAWALYNEKEYFVTGFVTCPKYGRLAVIPHPTDSNKIKVVEAADLTIL